MSNLVEHARRELELLGEESSTIVKYLDVVKSFSDMGHSGGSASMAVPVLCKLFRYQPLTPLTNDPAEWIHHGEDVWGEPNGIWQNKRNGEAFSQDGGITYRLLSEGGEGQDSRPLHKSVSK